MRLCSGFFTSKYDVEVYVIMMKVGVLSGVNRPDALHVKPIPPGIRILDEDSLISRVCFCVVLMGTSSIPCSVRVDL